MNTRNLWFVVGWGLFTYGTLLNLLEEFATIPSNIKAYFGLFLDLSSVAFIIPGFYNYLKEKKVKERRKRLLEEKCKVLFRSSSDAILIVRLNKIVDCNPKAMELFECGREQLLGKAIDTLSSVEQLEGLKQNGILKKLYLAYQGKPQFFQWRFLRCDGSKFTAEISMSKFSVDKEAFAQITIRDISEQEKTEKELAEERKKYSALFDNINDAIIIKNVKTGLLELNEKAIEMLGYSPEEVQKLGIDKIIFRNEPEDPKEKLELLIKKGHIPTCEKTLLKRDGTKIFAEIKISLVKNSNDEPLYIQSLIRDISDRKKALEAVKAEKDRARKVFDAAQNMMVIIDTKGVVRDINKKVCMILEYKREEIIGKNWFDSFIPEKTRDRVKNYFSTAISGELKLHECFESPVFTKSGEERFIVWHNTYLKDTKGDIIEILSFGEDITDRKKIEEKLLWNEEKFRILIESTGDLVFTLDRSYKITGLYGKWEEKFGVKPVDYSGKSVYELFSESNISQLEINKKSLEGGSQTYEWSMQQRGKRLYFQTKLYSLLDSKNDIAGIVGITRDITKLEEDRDLLRIRVKFHSFLLETLSKILQSKFTENPFKEILQKCIQIIPEAQAGSVLLKENGNYKCVATVGYNLEELSPLHFSPDELMLPETEEVLVIKEPQKYILHSKCSKALLNPKEFDRIKATLSIPVVINKEIKALFNLDTTESPEAFDKTAVEMSQILGKALSLLLERLEFEKTLKEQQKMLEFSSTHDALTGLPNRRFLFEHASQQFALAKRHGKFLSVLYMDLNGFKIINDTFGHEIGDILLKRVSYRLKDSIRESDIVARLGGDEFVFLLPDTDVSGATETVKRVLENLEKPFEISNKELKISASFGIAVFPKNGKDLRELLRKADEAMYIAKKNNEAIYIFQDN
ncbi:PAS domain S-box protein [Kosmotoga arenicorallina]|nr:PAS domain S-box protein [Kosmotoga arenicorallina]